MNNKKELFLPSLKSNIKGDPVFSNNTDFISNTRAFYNDLYGNLDYNEKVLESICGNSLNKINKLRQITHKQISKYDD